MNDFNEVQWIQVSDGTESELIGYSTHISHSRIRKYR